MYATNINTPEKRVGKKITGKNLKCVKEKFNSAKLVMYIKCSKITPVSHTIPCTFLLCSIRLASASWEYYMYMYGDKTYNKPMFG